MSQKFRFKNQFRIERLAPDKVFLIAENTSYVLNGSIYYHLAPLLDGTHTVQEMTFALKEVASFFQINQALYLLQKRGYVIDAEPTLPSDAEMLCHLLKVDLAEATQRFFETAVFIHSVHPDLPTTLLAEAVKANGLQLVDSLDNATVCLLLTDDYLSPKLHEFQSWAMANGRSWLPIKPIGTKLYVGPLFHGDQAGCLHCLTQRMRLHRKVERALQYELENDAIITPPQLSLASSATLAINQAVTELMRWVVQGENEHITQNIVVTDILSHEQEAHPFTKRPQCPTCGDAGLYGRQVQQPLQLQSCPKSFTKDGGHRSVSPEETFERYSVHISKISGILGTFERTASSNQLIHNYNSGQNVFYDAPSYASLRFLLRSGDGGKGVSNAQSKASGLCEALERYSASYHGDEYFIESSYEALGELAIHPNDCMNYSQAQYAADGLPEGVDTFSVNQVPNPFDPQRIYRWTPVWSLTENRFKYMPTGYCYYNNFKESDAFPACSNGNAAGNTVEEAILQGFMELIERDSVGIWWYNQIQRPSVDLSSFDDPYICELLDYYSSINRELWVLDVTNDLGVPTFAAVSRKCDGSDREFLLYGFGAHFDPRIGVLRSLTEVNQCLTSFAGLERGEIPKFNAEATEWWQSATLENQPYLKPANEPLRRYDNYRPYWSNDIKTDVERLVDIMADRGLETLVLDQTRPDIGLNVVKVFVPGLCHFWRRAGADRLYQVPVEMGWRDTPLTESQLNSYSVFL